MKTKALTIVAFISELIETHQEKCDRAFNHDGDAGPDAIAHIVSEHWGTKADITLIANSGNTLRLELDDGAVFVIEVR